MTTEKDRVIVLEDDVSVNNTETDGHVNLQETSSTGDMNTALKVIFDSLKTINEQLAQSRINIELQVKDLEKNKETLKSYGEKLDANESKIVNQEAKNDGLVKQVIWASAIVLAVSVVGVTASVLLANSHDSSFYYNMVLERGALEQKIQAMDNSFELFKAKNPSLNY